jgi:hypothetical protein
MYGAKGIGSMPMEASFVNRYKGPGDDFDSDIIG